MMYYEVSVGRTFDELTHDTQSLSRSNLPGQRPAVSVYLHAADRSIGSVQSEKLSLSVRPGQFLEHEILRWRGVFLINSYHNPQRRRCLSLRRCLSVSQLVLRSLVLGENPFFVFDQAASVGGFQGAPACALFFSLEALDTLSFGSYNIPIPHLSQDTIVLVGTRTRDEEIRYPDDDLRLLLKEEVL